MIASQRSLGGLVHQCMLDVNAPLGYVVSWVWAAAAGLSDRALRLPSMVFACASPLVALVPARLTQRPVRFVWAALLACWLPGFLFATEARCYSQLLFLATINAVAFAALLRAPALKVAFAWMAASCLLVLTHYFALALVGCQGLAYLFVHRGRAIRTWPALAAFAPAVAVLGARAALLLGFWAHGGPAAPQPGLGASLELVEFLLGGRLASLVVAGWAALSLILMRLSRPPDASEERADPRLWLVSAVSLCAAALCLGASLLWPIVRERYLTAMVPGVLMGVAMMAQRLARGWRLCAAALIAVEFGLALGLLGGALHDGRHLSFEAASQALMDAHARRVTFFWDSPAGSGADPDILTQAGGFFFRRAGSPTQVHALVLGPGQDPNEILAPLARTPNSGLLWIYDAGRKGAAALRFPPRLARLDPRWRCRDFGDGTDHVVTCISSGAI
jgi:hypothetical protein